MVEFFSSNWQTIVGVLIIIIGGFYIPGLRKLWIKAFQALLTEKVLTQLFLVVAERLVKSTKTTLDDVWLEELKKKINQA